MDRWLVIALGPLVFATASGPSATIDGFGRDLEDAKAAARHAVLERLQQRLAGREWTAWQPTLADADALVDGPGAAGPSELVDGELRHSWVLSVRFPSDAELELRDRRARRQWGAACLAAAAIAAAGAWSAIGHARRREAG